jgi:hypothetical protein
MQFLIRLVLVLIAVVFFVPEPSPASIIFKPGQKAEYVPPGEEEINGNAAEVYQTAQSAEKENNLKRAIRAYKTRWLLLLFFVLLNYRNKPTNTLQQPNHISSWLKDTRATHILMRRSRGNFVLVRFI